MALHKHERWRVPPFTLACVVYNSVLRRTVCTAVRLALCVELRIILYMRYIIALLILLKLAEFVAAYLTGVFMARRDTEV